MYRYAIRENSIILTQTVRQLLVHVWGFCVRVDTKYIIRETPSFPSFPWIYIHVYLCPLRVTCTASSFNFTALDEIRWFEYSDLVTSGPGSESRSFKLLLRSYHIRVFSIPFYHCHNLSWLTQRQPNIQGPCQWLVAWSRVRRRLSFVFDFWLLQVINILVSCQCANLKSTLRHTYTHTHQV